MYIRNAAALGIWLSITLSPLVSWAAEPLQINVCPSREKAEQIVQSSGNLMPEGCRKVTITRVDSPAGPLCVMDFGQDGQGIIGTIKDAAITTQWWTPCSSLHSP
jgi:hypothetical protein